jgi:5-methylcytosine-specific restriction protein A
MPRRPRKPCAQPGCPALIAIGRYCLPHERDADHVRGSRHERGYGTDHERWRRDVLALHPYCNDPYERHPTEMVPSTVADHIKPVRLGGEWTIENGQGLCNSCHAVKRQRERLL